MTRLLDNLKFAAILMLLIMLTVATKDRHVLKDLFKHAFTGAKPAHTTATALNISARP